MVDGLGVMKQPHGSAVQDPRPMRHENTAESVARSGSL